MTGVQTCALPISLILTRAAVWHKICSREKRTISAAEANLPRTAPSIGKWSADPTNRNSFCSIKGRLLECISTTCPFGVYVFLPPLGSLDGGGESKLSRSVCRKTSAALENTCDFFQIRFISKVSSGFNGRKQRLLCVVLISLSKVNAYPIPSSTIKEAL